MPNVFTQVCPRCNQQLEISINRPDARALQGTKMFCFRCAVPLIYDAGLHMMRRPICPPKADESLQHSWAVAEARLN